MIWSKSLIQSNQPKQWTLHLYMQCLHSFHFIHHADELRLSILQWDPMKFIPLFPAMLLQKAKKIWILAKLKTIAEYTISREVLTWRTWFNHVAFIIMFIFYTQIPRSILVYYHDWVYNGPPRHLIKKTPAWLQYLFSTAYQHFGGETLHDITQSFAKWFPWFPSISMLLSKRHCRAVTGIVLLPTPNFMHYCIFASANPSKSPSICCLFDHPPNG